MIDCFHRYEECLNQYNGTDKYNSPIQKSKIFAYVDAFPKSRKQKERFKNQKDFLFENENIWNLDSDNIEPLRKFLNDSFESICSHQDN